MDNFFTSGQLEAISLFYEQLIYSFAKTCKLIYNERFVENANSTILVDDTYLGNTGSHGGPIASEGPLQGGSDLIKQAVSANVSLVIDWTLKSDRQYSVNSVTPYATIKVMGYLTDLPKLQQCNEVWVDLPIAPIVVGKYRVLGEGADIFSIIQGKFFSAVLERVS